MFQLFPYQTRLKDEAAYKLASGTRKLLVQAPTGSGKTVIFSAITDGWLQNNDTSVLILVHRTELLSQTRAALYKHYNISAQPIVRGMRHIPTEKVYVGMIESSFKRIKLLKEKNIGLVIIDEAHLANFFKIHDYFKEQYILGFTATPYTANKKRPLKNYYEDIISAVQISELIPLNRLSQNYTYAPRDIVERASLTLKGGEFDEGFMAQKYSSPKYVNNTVAAYEKYAKGTKAIVFNCNVEHSKEVDKAFKLAGYQSFHVDGNTSDTLRRNILARFANTPGAILNNVGIATTGTDIPSIETVVVNHATKSHIKWLQETGRGARVTPTKKTFTIIDLGGNAVELGDWSDDRDWHDIFHNPKKPSEGGEAPSKSCPQCLLVVAAGTRTCPHCGFEFPIKEENIEGELSELVLVTKNIDVASMVLENINRKKYYTFFNLGRLLAEQAKAETKVMTDAKAAFILEKYYELVHKWCREQKIRFNRWHKDRAQEHLYTELSTRFKKWKNPLGVLDLTTEPKTPNDQRPTNNEQRTSGASVPATGASVTLVPSPKTL